ncbi:mesoderm induction early response protein 1-like [Tetranychus urticae]|uniref:Mesoderm induction early response protein 1 n=1 Tax=Tetranychus urticae TaxID=32264 RepID=T1JPU6_TETUR|nr:mesoderm induction early response protein 1-like [Tetranychus urticae]
MNANVDGMNKPSPTASVNTPSAHDSDQDFDPSAEMLINDFDDEHTLEEEEANDDCSNITNEIMDLKKEGEMPIEQLLALYGYEQSGNKADKPEQPESSNHGEGTNDGGNKNNCSYSEETAANASQETQVNTPSTTAVPTLTTNTRSSRHLEELSSQWTLPASAAPLPNTNLLIDRDESDMEDDDDEEDDEEEENDEDDEEDEGGDDWRRTIQVGSDYQAVIPDGLNGYGNVPPYENEDKLLWDASVLPEEVVVNFLRQISQIDVIENTDTLGTPGGTNGSGDNPESTTSTTVQPLKETTNLLHTSNIRDDEIALYLLHQCGHNVEEALRRKKIQQNSPFETMSSWSEEECINFEDGIRLYGKDFHQIQKNKVPTRSVGELVQFYYLWKKTERHDMYASKWRVEKKKYSLHPGTTDYMDRFIDEQENLALQAHSMSTSNYTRQQSHGSYSIIHYNYNTSSSGSASGQQPSNVPSRENVSDNISDPSTSQSNGAGLITGKSSNSVSSNITLSNGPETVNRNVAVSTTTNDSLTSGVSRENVQINSSNTNPSKTTSTSDLFSPLSKIRMNIVDR